MPALAPKRASKSLKAERDRDRAPPAYMVRGRKTPRDRDDSYSDDSSRSRSPSDDSRSKTRGFAATKTNARYKSPEPNDDEPVQRSDDLQPWRRKNQSELRRYQNCNFSPFEHEEYRPKR